MLRKVGNLLKIFHNEMSVTAVRTGSWGTLLTDNDFDPKSPKRPVQKKKTPIYHRYVTQIETSPL